MFPNSNSLQKMMEEFEKNPVLKEMLLKDMGHLANVVPKPGSNDVFSLIEQIRKESERARETEKKTRSIVPFPCQRKIRHIRAQEYSLARESNWQNQGFKQTFVTANKHSSKISELSSLKPIYIREMLVNKINYGRCLVCRVIENPYQISAITLLVEDEQNEVEDLSIYNYLSKDSFELLFPVGTVIYIKEPFLKLTKDGVGRCIRVDSPSDLLIDDYLFSASFREKLNQLKSSHDPEIIKQMGNEHYKNGKYDLALRCYKIALNLSPNNPCLFHLNSSAAYLGLELYSQAYNEAEKAVQLAKKEKNYGIHREKGLYRMGFAAYHMRQWLRAKENLSECLKENEENKEANKLLEKCTQRISEETTGVFDFYRLYKTVEMENNYNLDVADYNNEVLLTVKEDATLGKHVRAKTDIPRGTLLIVSKAFSFGQWDEKSLKTPTFSINIVYNTIDTPSQCENLSVLFKRIQGNPYLAKEVYSLYSSELFNRKERIPDHIVDVSRLECISSFNSFGGDALMCDQTIKNSFNSQQELERKVRETYQKSTGVWIYPSLLNHACASNCHRCFIGDVMVIFASRDIQKDEELTNSYYPPMSALEEREKHLKSYNFKCICELCEFERKDSKRKKRKDILESFSNLENKDYEEILKLLRSLEETYEVGAKFKLELLKPLASLQTYLYNIGNFKESANVSIKSYEILKEMQPDLALVTAKRIKHCYDLLKDSNKSGKWKKIVEQDDFFKSPELLATRFKTF